MFRKANSNATGNTGSKPAKTRELIPTIVTPDVHLLGNLVSEGSVDFSGTIDGNIRCDTLTLRPQGTVKGEINANSVSLHGTVKGLIRAKNVHLAASCKVEGIIMHEQLSIEDGAFVDGKFKRTDRIAEQAKMLEDMREAQEDEEEAFDSGSRSAGNTRMLENIRLIR